MKILMLSWEYPPRIVGGLARHVYWLSKYLAMKGLEVHVVTLSEGDSDYTELVEGVHVHRVNSYQIPSPDFTSWVHQFNYAMIKRGIEIVKNRNIDLIHAHDWLVAHASIVLKHVFRIPLVVTIHSTEYGRRGGIHNEFERHIHEIEWLLTYEAWKIIVCSNAMKHEVIRVFAAPEDKVHVIPNGFNALKEPASNYINYVKSKYCITNSNKVVLFVGRLVYEKGIHILLQAISSLAPQYPEIKAIIVGEGPMRNELEQMTYRLGIRDKVIFTGFINDDELSALYHIAYVAVFPSLYEPFGIVALEAMSASKPVIVSDVGGLSEIVISGKTGLKIRPNNVYDLIDALSYILNNEGVAHSMGKAGKEYVFKNYTWDKISKSTINIYEKVLAEYRMSSWKPFT